MARTPLNNVKEWVLEALVAMGGRVNFHTMVQFLEDAKKELLTPEDYLPQKGHPKDTQFKYYCRWAVTQLRQEGKVKRGSPRGIVELAEQTTAVHEKVASENGPRGSGRYYDESCGQILERYVQEYFEPGKEHSRDKIQAWFAENYPLFKPITVQCHIEKYTTNFRSRVHYNAGPEHDLLFRVDQDWSRLRLYRPDEDPPPIHKSTQSREPRAGGAKAKGKQSAGRRSFVERHRLLLEHLSRYGELTQSEQERLALTPEDVMAWLDALLVARPPALVVSPLFLWAAEGDPDPVRFTTRLAIRMTGDYLDRALSKPIASLEEYTWEHFGHWHLPQPHPGEVKWHGYLSVPATEPADRSASEKLDLFAHLPSDIISELVRDTSFLSVQQEWSAKAATKGDLGPLSRQMKLGIRRPLFLSQFEISVGETDGIGLKDLPESEALIRSHVVAGLSLGTFDEWRQNLRLSRDDTAERLLGHPLYAAIVQFEVQRMTASLSGEIAASLQWDNSGNCRLMINGNSNTPLWLACRTLLEDLGFWPATTSLNDAAWDAAVRCALSNLEILGVLEQAGDGLRLSDHFASKIKAHPGHPQNRGEKSYRVKLVQYLKKTSGGTP